MVVSRGSAIAWSAALHTLGIGLAGWATHGLYHEPAPAIELRTTRAHALHYLTLLPPKPQPELKSSPAAATVRRPAPPRRSEPTPVRIPRETHRALPVPRLMEHRRESPRPSLKVEVLEPGAVAGVIQTGTSHAAAPPPPIARGVDRPAGLIAAAGSACPELRLPADWSRREVAVAVAFVVDTNGKVEPSGLEVVESPGRPASRRPFYPRIYVVGAKAGREPGRIGPADYDSVAIDAVTSHMVRLTFRPALSDGSPVRSTVLVACHWSPGG
jgi:hypothetical protein